MLLKSMTLRLILSTIILIMVGCDKATDPPQISIAVLTTTTVTGITSTSATGGGNITSDGGAAVTARGVCWSKNTTPTITDSKTIDGSGTGTFASTITALDSNTTYNVRAFATNSAGTGYGTTVSFTTTSTTDSIVPDIITPEVTNDGWETDSLGSVGMVKQPIQNLINEIRNGMFTEVHSVVIVKNGKLVFEKYWQGHDFGNYPPNYYGALINFDRNTRHNTHSATKSFTSALVGIAIDKRFIHNVSDKIFNYLDQRYLTLNNSGREIITIEHMLKMASGLQWNEQEVSVSSSQMDMLQFNNSTDPVNYLLSKPVVSEPGTSFYYNGGGVDLLGVIVSNASSRSLPNFSNTYLFSPLGITNYNWVTLYPSGITAAHGDIHITPRDMAKFGYLFLNNGVWKGNRIISEQWVRASAQNHITPRQDLGAYGYGYLWWLKTYQSGGHTYDAYRADGWGGQQIVIFPALDMVIVFTGANYSTNPPCDELMENFILQAL